MEKMTPRGTTPAPGHPAHSPRNGNGEEDRALTRLKAAAAVVRHRQEILYDRFAERFLQTFDTMPDKGRDAIEAAAEAARKHLTYTGAITALQGMRLKEFLLRDLDRTAAELRVARAGAAQALDPSRLEAGALASIARVLEATGDKLHDFAHRADHALQYRTGEVTAAGTLTCTACAATLRFESTGTIPPCPRCPGTTFRKGY